LFIASLPIILLIFSALNIHKHSQIHKLLPWSQTNGRNKIFTTLPPQEIFTMKRKRSLSILLVLLLSSSCTGQQAGGLSQCSEASITQFMSKPTSDPSQCEVLCPGRCGTNNQQGQQQGQQGFGQQQQFGQNQFGQQQGFGQGQQQFGQQQGQQQFGQQQGQQQFGQQQFGQQQGQQQFGQQQQFGNNPFNRGAFGAGARASFSFILLLVAILAYY
jgi:hypothetical protein